MKKNVIFVLSIVILIIAVWAVKSNSHEYGFSPNKCQAVYKKNYMTKDGRIMDPSKNNITTSEGQAYMMLRSALSKDRKTFDLTYQWSKNNLQRKDKLFSWLWGESFSGEYKVLDHNSASDADIDIATALIIAYEKWGDKEYKEGVNEVINGIWDYETKIIDGKRVLMPGVNQTFSENIEVNPSYFAPYAFRNFQKYDETHNWNELVDSSYYYLEKVAAKTKTGLAPNWFLVQNGEIVLEASPKSDFSYDAIRVFARIYLDYILTKDKRALPILKKVQLFITNWEKTGKLYSNYKSNGELSDKNEFVGSIAILVPVINLFNQKAATDIYEKKLAPLFENGYWGAKNDYYAENLIWFGGYLYKYQGK